MAQSHTTDHQWHRGEHSKNDNSDMTFRKQKCKSTSSLFPSEMIAKLEGTQSAAKQNKTHINNGSNHKQ